MKHMTYEVLGEWIYKEHVFQVNPLTVAILKLSKMLKPQKIYFFKLKSGLALSCLTGYLWAKRA